MQANWSLVLNVLLLIGVVITIGRLMKARRQNSCSTTYQPPLGKVENNKPFDDIIAVRKVSYDAPSDEIELEEPVINVKIAKTPNINVDIEAQESPQNGSGKSIMIILQAKENRKLAGYELLQTVLAAGLRFGEGHLFHRHQNLNGQGPVLCSLAAATASGVFDLQNIGAFSVRGLCLFMQSSGNPTIDAERFSIMLETAKQLSDGLDTLLLDEQQRPLTQKNIAHYYRLLNIREVEQMEFAN